MNDPTINLPIASGAAIFAGDLGRSLVWGGIALFAVALLQSLFLPKAKKLGSASFATGSVFLFGAFITLGWLFVNNQFEYSYVWQHSDKASALQYKIASIWSGQQGSFLLWATTSAIFALLTLRGTGTYRRWYTAIYAAFLGSLCGILAYESPFVLQTFHGQAYIPVDGQGLVPSLQNYWIVIHPPTIFLGFGSLTVLFAYALSALITRNYIDWARLARPWSLVSLSLVGVGLCMGGLWAYETLGWGGFWKWDPVENTSFVPWICTAALIHGFLVQGTKGKWIFPNLFLGGLPFLLFMYGTFLTRSGFLGETSVHNFTEMEHTALIVLIIFGSLTILGFLGLWIWRWLQEPKAKQEERPAGTYREAWYKYGNVLLAGLGLASAIGMSVPFIQLLMGRQQKVVEEHLYHLVVSWFFVPIVLMMAIAPFVTWRGMSWRWLFVRIFNVFCVAFALVGVMMIVISNPNWGVHAVGGEKIDFPFGFKVAAMPWITFLVGICLFAAVASFWRICELWNRSKPSVGGFVAHIGVATAVAGLIISRGLERKQEFALQEDQLAFSSTPYALPYTLKLNQVNVDNLFDRNNKLKIDVTGDGGSYSVYPGFYYFLKDPDQGPKQMAWPAIHHELSHDSYYALAAQQLQTGDPQSIAPGQSKTFKVADFQTNQELDYTVTYNSFKREGQVASAGTKMLADLTVELPNHVKVHAKPGMEIAGQGGPQMIPANLDGDVYVSVAGMNAADKSMNFQLGYMRPIYWLDFYYKPMTILVWLGAGIMFVGGLISALYRRRVLKAVEELEESKAVESGVGKERALAPAS